jgi:hypothetical protein
MRHTIVQYRVAPDQVERNEALVRAVYDELGTLQPEGFSYVTFRLDESAFLHLATLEGVDARGPLPGVEAFRRFTEGIGERCVEPPVARDAAIVGSYRIFDT